MEAVARQYAERPQNAYVIRTGLVQLSAGRQFFDMGKIPGESIECIEKRVRPASGAQAACTTPCTAGRGSGGRDPRSNRPDFDVSHRTSKPHRGILLPDAYMRAVGPQPCICRNWQCMFVLDCIASAARCGSTFARTSASTS
jgi:hypothetical protein